LRSGKSLADIATAQGKTVEGLKTAITDAATKQLDAAVTAGKLTKDQETKLLAGLSTHLDDLVNGVRARPGFRFGFGIGGPGLMGGIDDVATYLGLKPAELETQLRSGKSLADIATAQGKTVEGLKTAITDAATKQLDAAVTAGKLSKDQETKVLSDLGSRLDDLVNGVGGRGGFGFGFGHRHGHGGWEGPGGDKGSAPQDSTPPPAAPAALAPAPATA
jgi:polyhydroxyalkanoate synthesis regulator phasin